MSESDDADETNRVGRPARAGRTPRVTADVYRESEAVAGVVRAGPATLVLGYATPVADALASGSLVPTHYVDVAPSVPESYVAALHVSGARIHDEVEFARRADGLYADGFSVAPGVGVVPCNPPDTILVRLRDREDPVDLLFSNAPEHEPFDAGSLSGTLPVYGTLDTATGEQTGRADGDLDAAEVTGRDPAGPTVVAIGDRAAAAAAAVESVTPDVVVEVRDEVRVVVDGDGTVTTRRDGGVAGRGT
jgi:hypothetical protein